jgi:hypothetical protein
MRLQPINTQKRYNNMHIINISYKKKITSYVKNQQTFMMTRAFISENVGGISKEIGTGEKHVLVIYH